MSEKISLDSSVITKKNIIGSMGWPGDSKHTKMMGVICRLSFQQICFSDDVSNFRQQYVWKNLHNNIRTNEDRCCILQYL